MVGRLNKLLKGKVKILHLNKWKHTDDTTDYSKVEGYYDIVLISDDACADVCKIGVQDFRVIDVRGYIFTSQIEDINKALEAISEGEAESA